jgi:hypothetical protein
MTTGWFNVLVTSLFPVAALWAILSSCYLLRSLRNQLEGAEEGELRWATSIIWSRDQKKSRQINSKLLCQLVSHCYFGHFSFSLAKRATLPCADRPEKFICIVLTYYLFDTFNRDRTHISWNGLYGHPISFHWKSITDIWAHGRLEPTDIVLVYSTIHNSEQLYFIRLY